MSLKKIVFICIAMIIMTVALKQGVWGERKGNDTSTQTSHISIEVNHLSTDANHLSTDDREHLIPLNNEIMIITVGVIVSAFIACIFLAKKNKLLFLCEKKEKNEPAFVIGKASL